MNSDAIKNLDLKTFSRLCRSFFDQMGFRTEEIAPAQGPEVSGVFILYSKSNDKPFSMFQCTASVADTSDTPLEKFKTAMDRARMPGGYFLSTGRFDQAASAFAAGNKVNLIDRDKLVDLANNMPESSRNILSEVLQAGEGLEEDDKISQHDCPKCGTRMSLKISEEGRYRSGKYWQCSSPDCGHIKAFF